MKVAVIMKMAIREVSSRFNKKLLSGIWATNRWFAAFFLLFWDGSKVVMQWIANPLSGVQFSPIPLCRWASGQSRKIVDLARKVRGFESRSAPEILIKKEANYAGN